MNRSLPLYGGKKETEAIQRFSKMISQLISIPSKPWILQRREMGRGDKRDDVIWRKKKSPSGLFAVVSLSLRLQEKYFVRAALMWMNYSSLRTQASDTSLCSSCGGY